MNRSLIPCLGWLGLIALALPANAGDCHKTKSAEQSKCEARAKACEQNAAKSCTKSVAVSAASAPVVTVAMRATPAPCPAPAPSAAASTKPAPCASPAPALVSCDPKKELAQSKPSCCTTSKGRVSTSGGKTNVVNVTPSGSVVAVAAPAPCDTPVVASHGQVQLPTIARARAGQPKQPSDESGLKGFLRRIIDDEDDSAAEADAMTAEADAMTAEADAMTAEADAMAAEADAMAAEADAMAAEADAMAAEIEAMAEAAAEAAEAAAESAADFADEMEWSKDFDPCEDSDDPETVMSFGYPGFRAWHGDDDHGDDDEEDEGDEDEGDDEDGDDEDGEEYMDLAELQALCDPETLESLQALGALNDPDGKVRVLRLSELEGKQRKLAGVDAKRVREHAKRYAEEAQRGMREALKASKHMKKNAGSYQADLERAHEALRQAMEATNGDQLRALETLRELGSRHSKCSPPREAIRQRPVTRERESELERRERESELERRVRELEQRMRESGKLKSKDDGDRSLEDRVERLERAMRNDPDDFVNGTRAPQRRLRVEEFPEVEVVSPEEIEERMQAYVQEEPLGVAPTEGFQYGLFHTPQFQMHQKLPTTWKAPTAFTLPRAPAPPTAARAPMPPKSPTAARAPHAPSAPRAPAAPAAPSRDDDEARNSARAKLERLMRDMHTEVQSLRDEMSRLRRELEELPDTMAEDTAR